MEGLVILWMVVWLILSLCLPCGGTVQMCCPKSDMQRLRENASASSFDLQEKYAWKTTFLLHILLLSILLVNYVLRIALFFLVFFFILKPNFNNLFKRNENKVIYHEAESASSKLKNAK